MMRHLVSLIACSVLAHATYYAAQVPAAPQPGTFTFRDERSRTIDLTVADVVGVRLVWPELVDARWHTVLLAVQINADAAATDPYYRLPQVARPIGSTFLLGMLANDF